MSRKHNTKHNRKRSNYPQRLTKRSVSSADYDDARPVSSLKGQAMTTYEPKWWHVMKGVKTDYDDAI